MRQPLFKFGDDVSVDMEMRAKEDNQFMSIESFVGKVVGIGYDPADGTNGWPYYNYTICIQGAKISRPERLLKAKEV